MKEKDSTLDIAKSTKDKEKKDAPSRKFKKKFFKNLPQGLFRKYAPYILFEMVRTYVQKEVNGVLTTIENHPNAKEILTSTYELVWKDKDGNEITYQDTLLQLAWRAGELETIWVRTKQTDGCKPVVKHCREQRTPLDPYSIYICAFTIRRKNCFFR